ncbi:MAG: hypothetical protein EA381_08390 [Planctomycetaceae bacterium]|nr:MAG: hypothetical protein EA381_08390 [Planctomycetaceae bacterium]
MAASLGSGNEKPVPDEPIGKRATVEKTLTPAAGSWSKRRKLGRNVGSQVRSAGNGWISAKKNRIEGLLLRTGLLGCFDRAAAKRSRWEKRGVLGVLLHKPFGELGEPEIWSLCRNYDQSDVGFSSDMFILSPAGRVAK